MHEAKSRLTELGLCVWKGERIVIAKAGKPYLDIQPRKEPRKQRIPDRLAGRIKIAPDFDATPRDIIDTFEVNTSEGWITQGA